MERTWMLMESVLWMESDRKILQSESIRVYHKSMHRDCK